MPDQNTPTMDDRTLIERAAKAYGIEIFGWTKCRLGVDVAIYLMDGMECYFQPLLNNTLTDCMGDALRLAVELGFDMMLYSDVKGVFHGDTGQQFAVDARWSDPCAATRRAITRAAAALAQGE